MGGCVEVTHKYYAILCKRHPLILVSVGGGLRTNPSQILRDDYSIKKIFGVMTYSHRQGFWVIVLAAKSSR